MKVYNIDWVIDLDEAYAILDEMDYKNAAAAIGVSADRYANMTTEERHDYAYDLWHHCPGLLDEFVGLPFEVKIPKELQDDTDITDWLSDEYGFCINSYQLDTDTE